MIKLDKEEYNKLVFNVVEEFLDLFKKKKFKDALKLYSKYKDYDILSSNCTCTGKNAQYDHLKAIKILYSKRPVVFNDMDNEIFEKLKYDTALSIFFTHKALIRIEKTFNFNIEYKYKYFDCIRLLKDFVFLQVRVDSYERGDKKIYGESANFLIENYDCEICKTNKCFEDKILKAKDLPELPNPKCPKDTGCTCYYKYISNRQAYLKAHDLDF